jgi:hypothetical protein
MAYNTNVCESFQNLLKINLKKLNMWANRITLDFVKHDEARAKIQSKLDEKGITDECITDLHIFADRGYVGYRVTLSDKSCFTIFDNGNEV